MAEIPALVLSRRGLASVSAGGGLVLVRYHGHDRRRQPMSEVLSACRAYHTISGDWIKNPNGTVRSTAFSARLQASPTPRICFPVAFDGSIGHRQEYRSAVAAASAPVSRVKSPRSYGLAEPGSRTRTMRPGAVLKLPCHSPSAWVICTAVSGP